MTPVALDYPKWLSPQIAPGIPIRWYGVMYLLAFATTFVLFRYEARRSGLTSDRDLIASFFYWAILGALLGARLFFVLVFDEARDYLQQPWLIVWPFRNGRFVGIQGMSYHGGLLGVIAGVTTFSLVRRVDLRSWGDTLAVAAPLGYTFGRIGNFINGELEGRVTTVSWGVVFPQVRRFRLDTEWVAEILKTKAIAPGEEVLMVNLPRHPSQLYEALLEGIVLWLLLWFVFRPRRLFPGACIALYVCGYGMARFLAEYFRATDEAVGYAVTLGNRAALPQFTSSVLHITPAQLVSLAMVAAGVLLLLLFRLTRPPEPVVETFDRPG